MPSLRPVVLVVLLAAAGGAAACATRSPSIADLQYNPGRYYDKTVRVEGIVSSSWGVPLVPFKVYRIEDATGEVTVLSHTSRVPPRGARVEVTGRVEEVATFGGRSIGMHIKERHLRVLGRS
jgi:hypothetical protein